MSALQPDLSEARRLLGAGMKLVKMIDFTKQPAGGKKWNQHPVSTIDPNATGYGLILAPNKLCSIDPDHHDGAIVGMRALGFDLVALMQAGVQTRSTRPGSGGRSTFAWEGNLDWLTFACEKYGTILELRADSANLQDTIPGIVYRDKAGNLCTQQYVNGRRLDEAPPLPDALLDWWERCSSDVTFLREQQDKFFAGIAAHFGDTLEKVRPNKAISTGRSERVKLAFEASGYRGPFNRAHKVEDILERHGYTYHRDLDRWSHAKATGAPGLRRIEGKDDLWCSDNGGDPLKGTFDAWSAFVVLDHHHDVEAAKRAVEAEGLVRPFVDDDYEFARGEDGGGQHADQGEDEGGAHVHQTADDTPLFQTADTLRATAHETPAPIIEGVLLRGATLVHGPAKKGKSWLLLQMALAVDEGASFLGHPTSRFDALYVGAEDTPARFKSRLERMFARGTLKFMDREALIRFARMMRRAAGSSSITVEKAITELWTAAGKPTVMFIDTQEVFEVILGITHGKPGDSITRRDYQATSSYDGIANRLGIAIVLVGHWGEIKSIEKATINPHECLNTTKARLAGVTTSITLGPLPNQEPGEATHDMQLSIRSRDLPGGDRFLWVQQDKDTGIYTSLGTVRDVLLTRAQSELFTVLIDTRKEHGAERWLSAAEIAEELGCSPQAVKQMVARVRKAAKAKGRKVIYQGFELESKPNKGYRLK